MSRDVAFVMNPDTGRPTSRYNLIRLYVNQESRMVQETWDRLPITPQPEDGYHEVVASEAHRPDLLALAYYGDLNLYWVLAQANQMTDPFAETTVGKKLRIPNSTYVFQLLTQR
jgi:hypothetical protein